MVVCLFRCVAVIPAYSGRLRLICGQAHIWRQSSNRSASKRAALHLNRVGICVFCSRICECVVDRLRVLYTSDASTLTSGCQVRTNEELVPQPQVDVVSLLWVTVVETWVGGE